MSKTIITEEILDTQVSNEQIKTISEDGLHTSFDTKKITSITKLVTYDDESTETITERVESEVDPVAPINAEEVDTQLPMRKFNGVTWYRYNYDTSSWEVDSDQTDHHTIFLND